MLAPEAFSETFTVARTLAELDAVLAPLRSRQKKIGFVPTMGALHQGHAALLQRAARENDAAVLSIFVNPTQFGPNEDLAKYPRTLESDLEIARAAGVRAVFVPDVETIYPPGFSTYVEAGAVAEPLCGARRPGHFRGVCTVVLRLFNLVQAQRAYFGEKDMQQLLVLQRMVKDLGVPVEIVPCATQREADGLALSSRNRYLSPEERALAPQLYALLQEGAQQAKSARKSPETVLSELRAKLDPSFKIDYLEFRSLPDLGPLPSFGPPSALFVAAFLGSTRLIDNIIL